MILLETNRKPKLKDMNTKKLDGVLDVALWVIFGLSVVAFFFICRSIKAPNFEVADTSIKIPYVYSSEDGERYNSYYVAAWKHERFSKPKVAVYDPRNGKSAEIKPEYIEEYKAKMPASKYPFYTRWTAVIFGLLFIASAFFVYWVGGFFRDLILYMRLKSNPEFTECAYFLYEDRVAFKKETQALISAGIGKYIDTKSDELLQRYNPTFVKLLIYILNRVRISHNTEVKYYLTYKNNTMDQDKYLARLRSYWDSQIGQDKNAESNVQLINKLMENTYTPIKLLVTEEDIVGAVNRQLNKLFTDVLGSEVLKFVGAESAYAKACKTPGAIFIDINVSNHHQSFTWSGNSVPTGHHIPGLSVDFNIFHFVNGVENVLWRRRLVPKCSYTANDNTFAMSELYKSMVIDTINTFEENEKA
jgi:hypothetical protein